jgi:peptide/nickel transport system ATP-binding protein
VMYLGRIVEEATASRIFTAPQHPYTSALLAAAPVPDPAAARMDLQARHLGGEVPSATSLPSGCRFRLRCPRAQTICAEQEPPLEPVAEDHAVACHFPDLSGAGTAARVS